MTHLIKWNKCKQTQGTHCPDIKVLDDHYQVVFWAEYSLVDQCGINGCKNKAYVFEQDKVLIDRRAAEAPSISPECLFFFQIACFHDFLVPVENVLFNGFIKRLD